MSDFTKARFMIHSLTVYRNILADETVSRFLRLLTAAEGGDAASFCAEYGSFYHSLSEANAKISLSEYMEELVRYDDNAFSRAVASNSIGKIDQSLFKAAERDLFAIDQLCAITARELKIMVGDSPETTDIIAALPEYASRERKLFSVQHSNEIVFEAEEFYRKNGYGVFAKFGAFRWQAGKGLISVPNPDPVRLSSLKEYEYERGIVATNTLDFVEGRGGGNLLLYGDRGTGKSSTVKALANEYRAQGLRIIEVSKDAIPEFFEVLERLRIVPLRFVLFLDDLTFSEDDAAFSALKTVLEGGVAARPENCLVYATSNRRHLVKESFSERNADDVHAGDTIQEKLALYDRFDQTVNFFAPDQEKYLAIIHALANERHLCIAKEELELGAVRWAIRSGGRSPRTARQFIDWATSQVQKGASVID